MKPGPMRKTDLGEDIVLLRLKRLGVDETSRAVTRHSHLRVFLVFLSTFYMTSCRFSHLTDVKSYEKSCLRNCG